MNYKFSHITSSKQDVNDADIDFVVIWVDGSDKEWLKNKQKYSSTQKSKTTIDDDATRYRDWDNLQYMFRAFEQFTPWVRKIHFVTYGHIPHWLDTTNPKINIVRHDEYIPEQYLPVFSSHPIELNLHRIKGLAEQFVFFNDDMFITKPMEKTDFFVNGLPCDQAQLSRVLSRDNTDIFPHIILNNVGMLNKYFDKNRVIKQHLSKWFSPRYGLTANIRNLLLLPYSHFPGFSWNHLPSAFLKSTFDEVWATDFDTMDQTSSHKFRSIQDVNQYAIRQWQIANGKFYPKNMFGKYGKLYADITTQTAEACAAIEKQSYSMICMNDEKNDENFEAKKLAIANSFQKILPKKSGFEI